MAMEMFGLILVLVLAGQYIDNKMGNAKSYVTAILVIVGVAFWRKHEVVRLLPRKGGGYVMTKEPAIRVSVNKVDISDEVE